MADIQKFVDKIKDLKFSEERKPDRLSRNILDIWPGNQIVNVDMARRLTIGKVAEGTYQGVFAKSDTVKDMYDDIVVTNKSIDCMSIDKAIEAEGVAVQREKQDESLIEKAGI